MKFPPIVNTGSASLIKINSLNSVLPKSKFNLNNRVLKIIFKTQDIKTNNNALYVGNCGKIINVVNLRNMQIHIVEYFIHDKRIEFIKDSIQ